MRVFNEVLSLIKEGFSKVSRKKKIFIASFITLLLFPIITSAVVVKNQCTDSFVAKVLKISEACPGVSSSIKSGEVAFTDASGRQISLDLSELTNFMNEQRSNGISSFEVGGNGTTLTVTASNGESRSLDLDQLSKTPELSIDGVFLNISGGNTIDLTKTLRLTDYYAGTGITVSGSRVIAAKLGTSIATDEIENSAVTTEKLSDQNVTTDKIADQNVTTEKLKDESVTTDKLKDESVTTEKVLDENITTEKLADDAVTNIKIEESAITTDKIADGTILFADLNDNDCQGGQIIKYSGTDWTCGTGISVGDVKSGMQTTDHGGWVKLDGRSISSLTAEQQTAAQALGLSGNLPNAANSFLVQNNQTLGSVAGSNDRTIAQNQLPNNTLSGTTDSAGNHSHSYNSAGGSGTWAYGVAGGNQQFLGGDNSGVTSTDGTHTHNFTTSSINGGVSQQQLNITPRSLSVNMFIYLGF